MGGGCVGLSETVPQTAKTGIVCQFIEAGDDDHRVHAEAVLYFTLCSRLFCVGIRRHPHNAEK